MPNAILPEVQGKVGIQADKGFEFKIMKYKAVCQANRFSFLPIVFESDENPEIYLFYLQNIKNNTSNQSYKAKHKHQDIMILTIITCRKPRQHNNTPHQYNNRTKYNRFKHEFQRLKE